MCMAPPLKLQALLFEDLKRKDEKANFAILNATNRNIIETVVEPLATSLARVCTADKTNG